MLKIGKALKNLSNLTPFSHKILITKGAWHGYKLNGLKLQYDCLFFSLISPISESLRESQFIWKALRNCLFGIGDPGSHIMRRSVVISIVFTRFLSKA